MIRNKKKHISRICTRHHWLAVIASSLLPLISTQAQTQKIDITQLYKETVDKSLELDSIKQALEDKRKVQMKELKKIAAEHKILQADSAKLRKEVEKLNGRTELKEMQKLKEEEARCLSSIATTREKVKHLRTTVSRMKEEMSSLNQKQQHLDKIEDSVVNNIVSSSTAYLSLPFSKQDATRLNELKSQCIKYKGNHRADSLTRIVQQALANKTAYDKARNALESPYHRNDVNLQASTLRGLKALCAEQRQEQEATLHQLAAYEQGVATLRLFVHAFAKEREMEMLTVSDCNDAVNLILKDNNMQQRIKEYVEIVPFLNRQYKAYRKAIKANFSTPTDIEKEILEGTDN